MDRREIEAIAHFRKALWYDDDTGVRQAIDTLAPVALLDLTPERQVDRVSQCLIENANRMGPRANAHVVQMPFYRLLPKERWTLMALHVSRWSYARIGRVLELSVDEVEELAWGARLHLAPPGAFIPTGSLWGAGSSCPDYHPGRPWTQRFLDEELSVRERIFLESHLQGCKTCQEALVRSRNLYYQVASQVPGIDTPASPPIAMIRGLERVVERSRRLRRRSSRGFLQSLGVFVRRWDVRLVLSVALVGIAWGVFSGIH